MALQAGGSGLQTLTRLDFDGEGIASGPDTFQVFRNTRGHVTLSHRFRLSGDSSVELSDTAYDRDFPEFLAFFPLQRTGHLAVHFAFLTPTPRETFNIALVGPELYSLTRNGFAFWLQARDGTLRHVSDSIPRKLLELSAFVWYQVDVAYDVQGGTYDLVIREEGRSDPVVDLRAVPNAARHRGSSVDRLSFVTDPEEDRSRAVFYVDDISVAASSATPQPDFIAPGRRRLFLDRWNESEHLLQEKPRCLPAASLSELGISDRDLWLLNREGLLSSLERLLSRQPIDPESRDKFPTEVLARIESIEKWSEGCHALAQGRGEPALRKFSDARAGSPEGRIYALSELLAYVSAARWDDVNRCLKSLYADWREDPRYWAVLATAALASGDFSTAEEWLRAEAEAPLHGSEPGEPAAAAPPLLAARWNQEAGQRILRDQFFFALLWRGSTLPARKYALAQSSRTELPAEYRAHWLERAADAAFVEGSASEAKTLYGASLALHSSPGVLLKISDACFRLGDLEGEKLFRERIYGSLAPALER